MEAWFASLKPHPLASIEAMFEFKLADNDYAAALEANGLPGPLAAMLADSDAGAAKGGLDGPGAPLEALIGRPATPMSVTIRATLGA